MGLPNIFELKWHIIELIYDTIRNIPLMSIIIHKITFLKHLLVSGQSLYFNFNGSYRHSSQVFLNQFLDGPALYCKSNYIRKIVTSVHGKSVGMLPFSLMVRFCARIYIVSDVRILVDKAKDCTLYVQHIISIYTCIQTPTNCCGGKKNMTNLCRFELL